MFKNTDWTGWTDYHMDDATSISRKSTIIIKHLLINYLFELIQHLWSMY